MQHSLPLENIGFYTLSDKRIKDGDFILYRCELILTDRCNFSCSYCRGQKPEYKGDMTLERAKEIVKGWTDKNVKNIRFSGGEPLIWMDLDKLVKYTRSFDCVKNIAISTNGTAPLSRYQKLVKLGVTDFSISFDACCSKTYDKMSGTNSKFETIENNIKELSKITYVTVGVVINDVNESEMNTTIKLAEELGVSDIRVISTAQSNKNLKTPKLDKHLPIYEYRMSNYERGLTIRGLNKDTDTNKCYLVKDDIAVIGNHHYPCVIYLREMGEPISTIDDKNIETIMGERRKWSRNHNALNDPICSRNCLDVCRHFNNRYEDLNFIKKGN